MWSLSKQTMGASLGALTTVIITVAPAAAADIFPEEAPPPQYVDGGAYPVDGYVEEEYVERGPRWYGELAPPPVVYAPPPVAYYVPGPVVAVPPPAYYVRPYAYGVPPYAVARAGRHVVRGVGYHGHWSRPHPRRW